VGVVRLSSLSLLQGCHTSPRSRETLRDAHGPCAGGATTHAYTTHTHTHTYTHTRTHARTPHPHTHRRCAGSAPRRHCTAHTRARTHTHFHTHEYCQVRAAAVLALRTFIGGASGSEQRVHIELNIALTLPVITSDARYGCVCVCVCVPGAFRVRPVGVCIVCVCLNVWDVCVSCVWVLCLCVHVCAPASVTVTV